MDPELDESRDQVAGLGRAPIAPHSASRRKGFGSSSIGHRSTGGSSVGSGTTRSQTDGSEVTSIDFNASNGDDPFAFGQLTSWPGNHVKSLFKASNHWSRPRELISEVITQTSPHKHGSNKSKPNAAHLLTSLRELTAHLSGGYGWPSGADRIEPLCKSLHSLLGEFKGREANLFGSKDVNNENKVVRLVYAHLMTIAHSDAAIKHRTGALASLDTSSPPSINSSRHSKYSIPNEIVASTLATAEAEMLMHDFLPRRCLAASLYGAFAVLVVDSVNATSSGLRLDNALKQLPSLLRTLVEEGTRVLGPKAKPKAKKAHDDAQILLGYVASTARTWVTTADANMMFRQAMKQNTFLNTMVLPPEESSASQKMPCPRQNVISFQPKYTIAKVHDAEEEEESVPMTLISPLSTSALSPVSPTTVIRQAMASLVVLAQHYPASVAVAFSGNLVPLSASISIHSSSESGFHFPSRRVLSSSSPSSNSSSSVGAFHGDCLSCVYYLRICCAIAFASLTCWSEHSGLKAMEGSVAKTEAYSVIVAALQDQRPRIQFEAIHCLFKVHPSSWWRALEASLTPPPAHTVMSLKEEGLRGIVARAGFATASFQSDDDAANNNGGGFTTSTSLTRSSIGQQAVERALSELQSAVSRGSGGSSHVEGLSVNTWLAATTALHHLTATATSTPPTQAISDSLDNVHESKGADVWDRRYHDELVAHSVCRSAAVMGRCYHSRYRQRNVLAHVVVSSLPKTDVSEQEHRERERHIIEEQKRATRSANSDLLGLSEVFLGVPQQTHLNTSPPPLPVGLQLASAVGSYSTSTSNEGCSHNNSFSSNGFSQTNGPEATDKGVFSEPNGLHNPSRIESGRNWQGADVAFEMSMKTERCLWQMAEFLLFAEPSTGSSSSTSSPATSPSSTGSSTVDKVRNPMLHAGAPWSIRRKCLEALIWVAPSNCAQQHHHHKQQQQQQQGMLAAIDIYASDERNVQRWAQIRQCVMEVGMTLPLHCLVELAKEMQLRITTDGLPMSMRLGLQVLVAWFKAAPCDVLGECLRQMWEACLDAANTAISEIELMTSSSSFSNQASKEAERKKSLKMHEESRSMVLESLFDILDWRLVSDMSSCSDLLIYHCQGMPEIDSWNSVGGSPRKVDQWATVMQAHRSAYTIIAAYATALASIHQSETEFNSSNDHHGLREWQASSAITNIITRLKRAILTEKLITRRCCVTALGNLALQLKEPCRFEVYQFLHGLLMEVEEANDIFGNNHERSQGLGTSDLLNEAIQALDAVYIAETSDDT